MNSRLFSLGAVMLTALIPTIYYSMHRDSPVAPTPIYSPTAQPPAEPPIVPPERPLPPPRILIPEADGKTRPLALAKADIQVAIAGPLARTTMILTFKSDQPRVLEGELDFPLPEGATISGYGLDVGGELVDGVPVPKEKARVAFEKEVRAGVDPGIAEATVGNNFRTRVYPIPANGTRTVKVEYVSDLNSAGQDLLYTVSLRWGQEMPFATLRIEVAQNPVKPSVQWADRERDLPFTQEGERYIADKTFEQAKFEDDLTIRLPGMAAKDTIAVERFTRASARTPEHFFLISDLPKPAEGPVATVTPKRIGVVWDTSMSHGEAKYGRELKLLMAHLKALGQIQVDLYTLNNTFQFRMSRTLSGDVESLAKDLSGPYDGGTNLGAMNLPAERDGQKYDYWLVFTDGLGNLGEAMPRAISTPAYFLTSDSRANHPLLRYLAEKSGGAYLNLNRLTDEQALGAIGKQPYSLLSVSVSEGRAADIYPNGSQPVQGRVLVSGRLLSDSATLTLNYGMNGQVREKKTITLSKSAATETGLVPRYWAQQRVASLALFEEENAESLQALGLDFNLVTPNTSLIVLETVEQYLRYSITPPKSRAKVYAAYMEAQKTRIAEEKTEENTRLREALAQWNDRKQWWNTNFRYAKNFRYMARAKKKGEASRNGQVVNETRTGQMDVSEATAGAPARSASGGFGGGAPAVSANRGYAGMGGRPSAAPRPASRPALMRVAAPESKKAVAGEEAEPVAGGTMLLKEWSPDTPYLKKMKAVKPDTAYAVYLEVRKEYAASPAFFLDCAEFFRAHGDNDTALRILTNIAELRLEDPQLLRIVAHRLGQLGYRDLAIAMFEKVKRLRPEEPQSWRDLALVYADRADSRATKNQKAALADYKQSLELLDKVILTEWDRFEGIESIALMEANRILTRMRNVPGGETAIVPLDKRLVQNLTCDVRILLTWDTDDTDMDLWVTEPSGETAIYDHPRTTIGGRMSKDFTQGYGPEEYCLKVAMPGKYRIQTNYYGSSQQRLTGGTTVQATVITNFGRPTEKRQYLTLRLTQEKRTVDVGNIVW